MARSLVLSLLSASVLSVSFVPSAWAGTPCSPSNPCEQGYECVEQTANCTDIACAPDMPNCAKSIDAGSCGMTYSECRPKVACDVTSDCAPGMVCHEMTHATCLESGSTAPCQPNTECMPRYDAGPPQCTTVTIKECTYRSALPCNVDLDCGDGFTCVDMEACTSGGSTGTGSTGGSTGSGGGVSQGLPAPPPLDAAVIPPYDAGFARDLPLPDATRPIESGCSVVGRRCQPVSKTCKVQADCFAGWSCVMPPCLPNSQCSAMCLPPSGWSESTGGGIKTGTSNDTTAPDAAVVPGGPVRDAGAGTSDAGHSTGHSGSSGGAPTGAPTTNTTDAGPTDANTSAPAKDNGEVDGGGCSMGHAAGVGAGAIQWLGVMGLLAGLRRRRKSA